MAVLFASVISDLLAATVVLFALILLWFSWNLDYWKKRQVPYVTPLPVVGNLLKRIRGQESFVTVIRPIYTKFRDNGYCGFFQWKKPVLLVYDPELVKHVLTKDFSSFHDRGLPYDPQGDPISANLFNMEGTQWKNLRNKLTPTFTSGKLKLMFNLMADVAEELSTCISDSIKKNSEIEMKDFLGRYATDLIGTCAFGIQCDSLRSGDTEFVKMSQAIFRPKFLVLLRFILNTINPKLARLVPLKYALRKEGGFFVKLMTDTVEYRQKNKIERNDFVNLMMQLREIDKTQEDRENHIELNNGIMTAQAIAFFIAGLDTVSNTVGWSLHELALNPTLQEKAAAEIRTVLAANGGKLTYEGLKSMDLIERIILEALRKWTPVGILFRNATRKVELTGTGLVLDKGTTIIVPVDSMHLDPGLYPDPQRFDPERFTEEAKNSRHAYAYLPFGDGPRVCIAERFAMLEMKLALVSLLETFQFSVGSKTDIKPKMDPKSFGPTATGGFWLKVEKRFQN